MQANNVLANGLGYAESLRRHQEELEAALRSVRDQRLRYQALFEFASDGYLVTDFQGVILESNYAAATILNTSKELLIGKPFPFYVDVGYRSFVYTWLTQLSRTQGRESWNLLVKPPGREARHIVLSAIVMDSAPPSEPSRLHWTLRDVSSHKQAEQALREATDFSNNLVDMVGAIIMVVDEAGFISRSNPYLHAVSGYEETELWGQDWIPLFIPTDERPAARLMMQRAVAVGMDKTGVFRFHTKAGAQRAVAWSARTLQSSSTGLRLVLVGIDFTELQTVQEQVLRNERLAAVGELMAGLVHESRNALQRTQACLSLLSFRVQGQPECIEVIDRIQKAQDDLHRLFETVRGYTAPILLARELCDTAQIWREAWANLAMRDESAELREELDETDRRCLVSPFHLRQVFSNLFDNALSMSSNDRIIQLHCREARLHDRPALQVSVRDNGPGFSPMGRLKAFEPFFTTKARGTGLGLSICRRIIEAHGGKLEIGSASPGAEIIILLPRSS